MIKNGNFLPFQDLTALFASQQGVFCYHLTVKLQRAHFRQLRFQKFSQIIPKNFVSFSKCVNLDQHTAFQVIGPEPACFEESPTGFFNDRTTNHFLWYTENYLQSSHYKKSKLCHHCISPYTFFPSFLVLFKFSFLFASYSGVIFVPRLYAECNFIFGLTPPPLPPPPQSNKNSSIDVMQNIL